MNPLDEPRSQPDVEALLQQCLDRAEHEQIDELERLCTLHPHAAEGLRRRYAMLARHGLVALPLAPGARFGKYRLIEELGRGGMGIVHLAEDTELQRRVALKLLSPELLGSPRAAERFRREIAALARIDHPGICTLHEAGDVHGQPFLAMRYVPGTSLAACFQGARRDGRRLAVAEVVRWLAEIAEAVGAAHAAGLVHRDLKPQNVMVGDDGRLVVLDFGLARDVQGDDATLTQSHDLLGTAGYMAPEQVRGGEVGPWTDVHALGAILHEALTLAPAFPGAHRTEVLHRVVHDEPLRVRSLRPDAPHDLELVVATCLDKQAGRRYPHATALAADLRRILARQPIAARPLPVWLRAWRWGQRNRVAAATIVALAALALVSSAFLWRIGSADRVARGQRLVLAALDAGQDADLSAMLAEAAYRLQPGVASLDFLRSRMFEAHEHGIWRLPGASFHEVVVVDDDHLLTYGADPWCAMWSRGKREAVRIETAAAINAVAVGPDHTVAIASAGGHLRFVTADGTPAAIPDRQLGQGRFLAWLDTTHLAVGQLGRVAVLDVHSGAIVSSPCLDDPAPGSRFDPQASAVRCVASTDGSTLVTGGVGQVHVHAMANGVPLRTTRLRGLPPDAMFWALDVSADGSKVVAAASTYAGGTDFNGARARFAGLWVRRPAGYECRHASADHGSMAMRIRFAPDGSRFAIGTDDGTVCVCDGESGQLLARTSVRVGAMVPALSWSIDGRRLAATVVARGTYLFDRDGHLLDELRCFGFFGNAFTADGLLWTVELEVLQALRPEQPRALAGHGSPLYFATALRDGRVATCGKDGRLLIWRDGAPQRRLDDEGSDRTWALHCAESAAGELLTASIDGRIRRFGTDGTCGRTEPLGTGAPQRVLPLPDGRTIAVTSPPPSVHVLGPDLERLASFDGPGAWGSDVTADGRWLVVAGASTHELWLYDLAGVERGAARRIPVPTIWMLRAVAIADDASFVVAGGGDGVLHRFDLRTGACAAWQAHDGPMLDADIAADGRIATSGNDATAAVWSRDGTLLARLSGHRLAIWSARFGPDGRSLLTASDDGTARVWPLGADDVLAWARECLRPERRTRELDALRAIVGDLLDDR